MKKSKLMKYLLEIDEDHAKVIIEALDFYSRVHMGQLEVIAEQHIDSFTNTEAYERFRQTLDILKSDLGIHANAHWGIRSPKVIEGAKLAFDIQQIIRHRLAWDRCPTGGLGVDFQKLFKCSQSKSLPKIYGEKHDNQS